MRAKLLPVQNIRAKKHRGHGPLYGPRPRLHRDIVGYTPQKRTVALRCQRARSPAADKDSICWP